MLLQLGVVKHLPDPPGGNFDSDKVNLSPAAFPLGVPDAPIGFAAFATSLPLIAIHPTSTTARRILAAKSSFEAAASIRYLYLMPSREKAWCPYCVAAALASIATAILAWLGVNESAEGDRDHHEWS
ncbi:MAG: vitamin K epoxide reductase family protein [Dehalococcoidia bacterium]